MEIDSVADFWETLKKSPHFNRSRDPRSGRPGREFLAIRSENGTESASDLVYPSEILYFCCCLRRDGRYITHSQGQKNLFLKYPAGST